MSLPFVAMFVFGLVLLGSWAGWGVALERLLFRRVVADRALHAGWGLAFWLFAGGLLNLFGAIRPASVLVLVAAGLALLLADVWRRRRRLARVARHIASRIRYRWLWIAVAAIVCVAAGVAYAASICWTDFNVHDDYHAYLVFPKKMIQTGALGPDPYSERRLLSLGGMSFLHATILSAADVRYLGIVDPGVPLLMSIALLLGMARAARTSGWALAPLLLLFLAIPPPWVNTTSVVSGLALFLTLARTLDFVPRDGRVRLVAAVPVGLAVAALCSLKTSHLPAAVLLVVATYCIKASFSRQQRGRLWAEAALAGGLSAAFLLPWMISLDQSNGTPLYPLLGLGFHGSAYGGYWHPGAGVTFDHRVALLRRFALDPRALPLFILAALAVLRRDLGRRRWVLAGWLLATAAACVAIALTGGYGTYRYTYAFLYAAVFTALLYAFPRCVGGGAARRRLECAAPLGVLAIASLVSVDARPMGSYWQGELKSIGSGVSASRQTRFMDEEARWYAEMQDVLPRGATVLTRLRYPFLLDFTRQRLFVDDAPGGSSPPPGMPFFQGEERLAEYVCGQAIRYVAYSHRSEAGFAEASFGDRARRRVFPWLRAQALHTLDFQRNLVRLGQTRRRLYDQGDLLVLDLGLSPDGRSLRCVSP